MARAGGAAQTKRIAAAKAAIEAAGFEISEVEFVEPPGTPTSDLGRSAALTEPDARTVKVRRALRGWKLVEALEAEASAVAGRGDGAGGATGGSGR